MSKISDKELLDIVSRIYGKPEVDYGYGGLNEEIFEDSEGLGLYDGWMNDAMNHTNRLETIEEGISIDPNLRVKNPFPPGKSPESYVVGFSDGRLIFRDSEGNFYIRRATKGK